LSKIIKGIGGIMTTLKYIDLFIASRRARGLSLLTIKWYRQILVRFAIKYPKLPKRPEALELFISTCPGGDERHHGYFRALRAFYRFVNRRCKVTNPVSLIDPPKLIHKQPAVLDHRDLYRLLSSVKNPVILAAITFLIDTGARLGELHSLKPCDLYQTDGNYIARISGKTGERIVPISGGTFRLLQRYLPFPYSKHRLGRLISIAFKDAGIRGTAHTMRHTFATLWGGSDLVLQRIMGHSKMDTLKLYHHMRTDALCIEHNKYTPLAFINTSNYQMAMI
jgi:integrase